MCCKLTRLPSSAHDDIRMAWTLTLPARQNNIYKRHVKQSEDNLLMILSVI